MGALPATKAAVLLAEYAERYIAKRTVDGASEQTLRIYRNWLTHPIVEDGRTHPGGITAHVPDVASLDSLAVQRYFTLLKERGLKASSRHQSLRTIRAFVAWLRKPTVCGPLPHGDPLDDVDVALPKALPPIPKVEDLQKVLDACGDGLSGLRNKAVVLALSDSGLRRQEALNMRIDDYRRGDRNTPPSFLVRLGKGGKDRIASCGEETSHAIARYLNERENYGPLDPLFAAESGERLTGRGLAQILHRLCERAGLPRDRWMHPHQLRHLCATLWLRAGVNIESLRLQLGHADISTTQKYLHLVPDDVQREHMRASPLARSGVRVR